MTTYVTPLNDMMFVMQDLAGLDRIAKLPGCEDVTPDLVRSILEEGGRFASEVLAPINKIGDEIGARVENGVVTTAPGFKEAYAKFVDGGWPTVVCRPEYGGQGMPHLLSMALHEMWDSANVAFSLCPMLTQGAVEAIEHHASDELRQRFLPKMVSGEWTGTMNLTEPQAGSDLAAVRTRAVPHGDHYKISGTKIFITYGEHDFTENIVHTVLARLPDAPEGVKGISLFIVPKYLVKPDGSLGARNDLQCVSLEHKLGIHASPTAVMSYGDKGGAIGYLVGEPNRGLEYMFTMMNRARLAIGVEGYGISERAYQQALAYARERIQGKPLGMQNARAAIIHHPDVRRMLMTMKSQTEAMRALGYYAMAHLDVAARHPDAKERAHGQAIVDLLTPVVKGWSTEVAIEIASLGVQIHGGMGFIEETGAAQHLRDARITSIYEGTTGIQAMDLIGRKVARDSGAAVKRLIGEMRQTQAALANAGDADSPSIGTSLNSGIVALEQATDYILSTFGQNPRAAAAGSVPYLMLFGTVAGGWQMARAVLASQRHLSQGATDKHFYETKIATARFYADHVLPKAAAYRYEIINGADSTLRLDEAQFS